MMGLKHVRLAVLGVVLSGSAMPAVAATDDGQIDIRSWRQGGEIRHQVVGFSGLSESDKRAAIEYLRELERVCQSKGQVGYLAVLGRSEEVPMSRVMGFVERQADQQGGVEHSALLDFKRVVRDGYRTSLDPASFGERVYNLCMLYGTE